MNKLLCILIFGRVFALTKLETRVYPLSVDCEETFNFATFDIQQITGYDLESALVTFYSVKENLDPYFITIKIIQPNTNFTVAAAEYWEGGLTNISGHTSQFIYSQINMGYQLEILCGGNPSYVGDFTLEFAVTSDFPNDDIGLEGDLNQDGGVNIIDVLALVDIILETGVGDVNTLKDMVRG